MGERDVLLTFLWGQCEIDMACGQKLKPRLAHPMNTIAPSCSRLTIVLAAIFTVAAAPANAALLLYYNFDDGAATVTDKSGLGHTGTVTGAMYTALGGGYNNTPGRSMEFQRRLGHHPG
jgi:hypothetical protein